MVFNFFRGVFRKPRKKAPEKHVPSYGRVPRVGERTYNRAMGQAEEVMKRVRGKEPR